MVLAFADALRVWRVGGLPAPGSAPQRHFFYGLSRELVDRVCCHVKRVDGHAKTPLPSLKDTWRS